MLKIQVFSCANVVFGTETLAAFQFTKDCSHLLCVKSVFHAEKCDKLVLA